MTRYTKTLVALLGALATWGLTASEDGVYSQPELWGALLALVTAAGVYAAPNRPPAGEPSDPAISEQGAADPVLLGILVVLVLILLVIGGVLSFG